MRVAIIGNLNNPLLALYLKELYNDSHILFVILDSKQLSKRDLDIWDERTCGYFSEG